MDAIATFSSLVSQPEEDIDLASSALAIAQAADPDLDPDVWISALQDFAVGIDSLHELSRRLFHELGFRGDTDAYNDPQNSFLNRVIERRLGIPITLSVVMIEVGRRAGIHLEGIGMPGHFLLRSPAEGRYIDAFGGGELLDRAGCEERFRRASGAGEEVEFGDHLLPVASNRQILYRMLNNLQQIYRANGMGRELEWVMRMKLSIPGTPPEEIVGVGEALVLQGRTTEAASEIEMVAASQPVLEARLIAVAQAMRASLN
jgi:regulator of sirC expression with transglutaminase-like and TPR domain